MIMFKKVSLLLPGWSTIIFPQMLLVPKSLGDLNVEQP